MNFVNAVAPATIDPIIPDSNNEDVDRILRCEYSAIKSYEQVIKKVNKKVDISKLQKFKAEHSKAVAFWTTQVRNEGKIPEGDSGMWGKVVEAYVETSKLLGNTLALKALKNGEQHTLSIYEDTLKNGHLTAAQKREVETTFIPLQQMHINNISVIEDKI